MVPRMFVAQSEAGILQIKRLMAVRIKGFISLHEDGVSEKQ